MDLSSDKGFAFCVKRDKVVRPRTVPKNGTVIDAGRKAVMKAIRAARKRAGLTQEKAAELRGHATSTISRWETGGVPQSWDELDRYANDLGQSIVLRFGPDTDEEPPPKWAGAMESRIVSEVVANREALYAALAADLVKAQLGRLPRRDEPHDGKQDQPPAGAGPTPGPST